MIIHTTNEIGQEITQGSRDWFRLRLGIPTTSQLHRVITPKKHELSDGRFAYAAELIAEQMLGVPIDAFEGGWTERGSKTEAEARDFYSFERSVDVTQVAFITTDEGDEGGSPDGLVDDGGPDGPGGVEIKCFGVKHHMKCLLGIDPVVAEPTQVQGLMRLTGRQWWDVLAYHPADPERGIPALPPVLERVRRDDVFIKKLDDAMKVFKADMAKAKARLEAIGPRGRIDGGDLKAMLLASIAMASEYHADGMSLDEIEALRVDLHEAVRREVLDDSDVADIMTDLDNGRWDEVRKMHTYVQRHLETEATPA